MKTVVIWTDCEIQEDQSQFGIEPAGLQAVRARYHEMQRISELSARKFLQGQWHAVVFREPALTRRSMFQDNWVRIRDLWHQEPCNILYLDSDTVFVNPVDCSTLGKNFRLFNHSFSHVPDCFDYYFNAGVRWYPASMSQDTWDFGDSLAVTWDLDIWDQEQIIFNHMLWLENHSLQSVLEPRMNWSAHTGLNLRDLDDLHRCNGCAWQDASIVHYHATRSSDRGIKLARALAQARGISL